MQKEEALIKKKIKIEPYGLTLDVYLVDKCHSEMVNIPAFKNLDASKLKTGNAWTYFNKNGKPYAVSFFKNATPKHISHECYHIVSGIFDYIGHTIDRRNDEPEAYLMGYLVEKIFELLYGNKWNKKS